MLNNHPLRLQRFNSIFHTSLKANPNATFILANQKIKQATENIVNPLFSFVDFSTLALFENIPFYDDKLLYFDTHHLNEIGSLKYAREAINDFIKFLP